MRLAIAVLLLVGCRSIARQTFEDCEEACGSLGVAEFRPQWGQMDNGRCECWPPAPRVSP